MHKFLFFLSFFYLQFQIAAQDNKVPDRQILDTLQITGYGRQNKVPGIAKTVHVIKLSEVQLQSIESIDDLLQSIASIDMRIRGSKGVQSDISIRGGNFEQVLILLNGIKINNPQTGHHHLDIPVDISMLDRIEIIEGATGQIYGANAYSGVINLITKNPTKKQATSTLKVGQYGYMKSDFDLANTFNKLSVYNALSYQRSSGYLTGDSINNTDFYGLKYYVNLQYAAKIPLHLQAGYHQKDFGAHSFYTAKYPWQYEKTKGYFIALDSRFGKKITWKPVLSYRLHFDEFQLFRESVYTYQNGFFIHRQDTAQYAPGVYYPGHNYHRTSTLIAGLQAQINSKAGQTTFNLKWENDAIWSNKLGKKRLKPVIINERISYDRYDERFYGEAGVNHAKKWKKFQLGAGINVLYSQVYKTQITGGAFVNYLHTDFMHYISVSSAARLPGFTDLYYSGPQNLGNPDLQPETAVTYEAGSKWHRQNSFASVSFFYRHAHHTIDWIKYQPDEKWQTQNLTGLHTYGAEVHFSRKFPQKFIKNIKLSYAYLNMQKDDNQSFISKYVLDYLKHKFNLELSHRFLFDSQMHWSGIYKDRNGQYLDYVNGQYRIFDYKPYFLTHLKITKQMRKTRLGLSIENLFDVAYNDLSYIKMPGRWVILEIKYRIY